MAAEKKESWSVRVHFASEVEATKFALMPGADKPERRVEHVCPHCDEPWPGCSASGVPLTDEQYQLTARLSANECSRLHYCCDATRADCERKTDAD